MQVAVGGPGKADLQVGAGDGSLGTDAHPEPCGGGVTIDRVSVREKIRVLRLGLA